jgi:hypothetical protein
LRPDSCPEFIQRRILSRETLNRAANSGTVKLRSSLVSSCSDNELSALVKMLAGTGLPLPRPHLAPAAILYRNAKSLQFALSEGCGLMVTTLDGRFQSGEPPQWPVTNSFRENGNRHGNAAPGDLELPSVPHLDCLTVTVSRHNGLHYSPISGGISLGCVTVQGRVPGGGV